MAAREGAGRQTQRHRHWPYWPDGLIDPLPSFAAAEDRVDGECGVAALLLGFAFQAVGYVLDLAVGGGSAHSASRAVTALALLVVAVGVAVAAWRGIRRPRLCELLVEMSRWKAPLGYEDAVRADKADPAVLVRWEFSLRTPRHDGEDDRAYAKRVFDLSDADVTCPTPDQDERQR